jgi:hypothetical protein
MGSVVRNLTLGAVNSEVLGMGAQASQTHIQYGDVRTYLVIPDADGDMTGWVEVKWTADDLDETGDMMNNEERPKKRAR